jgi:hypothetical protein
MRPLEIFHCRKRLLFHRFPLQIPSLIQYYDLVITRYPADLFSVSLSRLDPEGLKEVTKQCCEKLQKLINFDNQQSSAMGVLFSLKYNSVSMSDDLLGLNCAFESIGGPVDIDWMLRTAFFGYGSVPGISHALYYVAKPIWNMLNGNSPFTNLFDPSHTNAPSAARYWMNSGLSLSQMFAPAIETCKEKTEDGCSAYSYY